MYAVGIHGDLCTEGALNMPHVIGLTSLESISKIARQ
jgi:hypothetical protein